MPNKTAYRKMMDDKRKRERHPPSTGAKRHAEVVGKCNAHTRQGGKCRNPKGQGTDHYGYGPCKYHGGNAPSHKAKAAKDQAILMGAPKEINPLDAMMWCIRLTAGEVEFCSQQLELIEKADWLQDTIVGKQLHIWATERQKAVDRLAKHSKDALALGIAERAVRLAEQYGSSIAKFTKGLLSDLELTQEQQKAAPLLIRKHLALLEGGAPAEDTGDRKPIAAIPRRVGGSG
jgi:hypothetical protein